MAVRYWSRGIVVLVRVVVPLALHIDHQRESVVVTASQVNRRPGEVQPEAAFAVTG